MHKVREFCFIFSFQQFPLIDVTLFSCVVLVHSFTHGTDHVGATNIRLYTSGKDVSLLSKPPPILFRTRFACPSARQTLSPAAAKHLVLFLHRYLSALVVRANEPYTVSTHHRLADVTDVRERSTQEN